MMVSYKPRIVLSSESPSLFTASVSFHQSQEPLVPREVSLEKGPMFLSLFYNVHYQLGLPIPETLVKVENRVDPVFLMNDDRRGILWTETKAIDAFFNRVKCVQMMTSISHPSPLQVPAFVVWCDDRVTYCREQVEVLRLITCHRQYTVQRFILPRDEHVKKLRVKWAPGQQSVTLITRKTQIPYNNPKFRPTKAGKKRLKSRQKSRISDLPGQSLPFLPLARRKTFSDLAKFQSLAIAKGVVTPYTASFTCPDDCTLVPVQRQDVEEFIHSVVRFLQQKTESECDILRSLEIDLIQDHVGRWYLLSVKSYTIINREALLKYRVRSVQFAHNESISKSPLRRNFEGMKKFFERPLHKSISHTSYIDLGDVQDKNITLYQKISDSFA